MSEALLAAPKGMYDLLPGESGAWDVVVGRFFGLAGRFGYRQMRTPLLEQTDLFVRSVGEATDIVHKEMYTFTDRGGRSLTLRPEGTAGVVRAFVEHHQDQAGLPWKVSYSGPMYRAENVQRGRQREFFQVGVEAVGTEDPELDVEVVALAWRFFEEIGLGGVEILLNSVGTQAERAPFLAALRGHLTASVGDLGEEDRRRLVENPLRVLESQDPRVQEALADAPRLRDHLGSGSRVHFEAVCAGLDDLAIPYTISERLVRGLDYYTSTTFEFVATGLDAAQNAVGGGGRYDGLVELVGGPPLPGIGFGIGVERTLLALGGAGAVETPPALEVVVLRAGETQTTVRRLLDALRGAGRRADTPYGGRSLKAQLKAADRMGAAKAIIVGEKDLGDGVVTVRDLRSGEQSQIPLDEVVERC